LNDPLCDVADFFEQAVEDVEQTKMNRTLLQWFRTCLLVLSFGQFLLPAHVAMSEENPIHVASTVNVSSDNSRVPLGETWLAANPRDRKNMIAVSMAFPKDGPWASVMYHTIDGGRSWTRATHGPSHDAYFWGADPRK